TDAAAVQVVTVHASKGLEFPVVYVPFAFDRWLETKPVPQRFHDDAGTRLLHIGGHQDPTYADAAQRARAEDLGEDLRLTYVALTRASSQVVLWWSPSSNAATGPLTRLLLGGHGPGEVPAASVKVGADAVVAARLAEIARRSGGAVAHEQITAAPTPVRWQPSARDPAPLSVGRLGRGFDTSWRRTSYTGLTAAAHDATHGPGVSSEPETTGVQDEGDVSGAVVTPTDDVTRSAEVVIGADDASSPSVPTVLGSLDALRRLPSPMSDLPGGTTFGTLVHEVLEAVDTGASDLTAELAQRCGEAVLTRGLGVDPAALAAALEPVLRTPLGDLAGGRTLADIPTGDRLAELGFEMPLAGGDTPREHAATLSAVADLLDRHLTTDDVFAPYGERLRGPHLAGQRLRGYLTGSIDAVLRVPVDGTAPIASSAVRTPRYLVVDYKTNRLAPAAEPVTAWHYRPAAMVEAMMDAHYPLQLLLYSAALHRYLRWRQPGYDPDQHLGGGLYLFVRGMVGPDTPVVDGMPCGVMAWRPPTQLVVDLSAVLDGRRR
ncbi:MAG: Exodeoxyribonuclease, partial [Actinotalea sp.]|nr:Exodeoxyribonuclease [Actinotalea sp.]